MQDSGVEGNLSWFFKDKQVLGKEGIPYFKLKETLGWKPWQNIAESHTLEGLVESWSPLDNHASLL